MPVTVTFLGHAGFLLTDGRHTLAIDPFLTGNPDAKHKPEQIKPDVIALTHGHADHVGDTVALAKATGATVVGAFELCGFLQSQGVQNIEQANPGGRIVFDFCSVSFTQAFHSSSYEGQYMGQPMGLVAEIGGVKFHHCGDTALFGDMKLIGELYKPDICAIPVGDRFTMGPEHGRLAAEMIKPKIAIPIHWGTWPLLTSDINAFKPDGVEVKKMQAGDSFDYG